MRHFSCDLCGKTLIAGAGSRMILAVESYPAADELESSGGGTESDIVEEVARLLAEEEGSGPPPAAPAHRELFDLCIPCHRKIAANPLGRGRVAAPRFSGN